MNASTAPNEDESVLSTNSFNFPCEWQWRNATAGAVAGFSTVVTLHPLDIVRTRFQVHDGRHNSFPSYKSTIQALYSIARTEGLRGLYAGLFPAVIGASLSWGLYFSVYNCAKARHQKRIGGELGPGLHLVSAAEAGALVCLVTNPVWLVKTRLQLQAPEYGSHRRYSGFTDAVKSIIREEGWRSLYRGLGPSLLLVSHGALQFMAYEEGKKLLLQIRSKHYARKYEEQHTASLASLDFALLGAASKVFAATLTYPYQVVRARVQQRPTSGVPKYQNSLHAFRETLRYEGIPGLYKGMVPNLLRTVPSSAITFFVYENVIKLLS